MSYLKSSNLGAILLSVFVFTIDPASGTTSAGHCKIRINSELPSIQPLILNVGSSAILFPQTSDVVQISSRKQIRLFCPGKNNAFTFLETNGTLQNLTPHCVINSIFSPGNGQVYPINQLGCRKEAHATAVRRGICAKNSSHIQVGFDLLKGEFAPIMDLCFDQNNYDAVYSSFKLTPNIVGRQYNVSRPTFSPSTFYDNLNISSLYTRVRQRETIAKILGSKKLGNRYVKNDNLYFLARGHLSAKADFVYGFEQRGTFFYMNAAPQWQIFNAGNWEKLENSVRNYAAKRTSELIVVTGIWGTCSLPDEQGCLQPLHLYVDENGNQAVTVPGYYWKVLYDPKTKQGAAFVGINNPYLEERLLKTYVFCNDICAKFEWLKWDQFNIKRGYSFCCSMDEFRQTVKTVPDFEVESLLV